MRELRCRISTLLLVSWLVALTHGFLLTWQRWMAAHPTTRAYEVGARVVAFQTAQRNDSRQTRSDPALLLIPVAAGLAVSWRKQNGRSCSLWLSSLSQRSHRAAASEQRFQQVANGTRKCSKVE